MLNFEVLNLRKWKGWHIRSLLTELIHGLTDVVKDQITQSKLNQGATDQQIQDLTKVVNDLANTSSAASTTTERPQILRLPQVNLPSFNGQKDDDLERFLEQSIILLISSYVPSRYYVTYLKQQIHKHARAYVAISQAEEQHKNIIAHQSQQLTVIQFQQKNMTNVACFHGKHFSCLEGI